MDANGDRTDPVDQDGPVQTAGNLHQDGPVQTAGTNGTVLQDVEVDLMPIVRRVRAIFAYRIHAQRTFPVVISDDALRDDWPVGPPAPEAPLWTAYPQQDPNVVFCYPEDDHGQPEEAYGNENYDSDEDPWERYDIRPYMWNRTTGEITYLPLWVSQWNASASTPCER